MLLTDLSDHFGTFIAVAEKKGHVDKPKVVQIRDMSSFDLELFLQELEQRLRDAELEKNDSVNEQFDKFCVTFNSVVKKIAPLRKASRKEKRLHAKPWLTKGLLKSIKRKHALFSKLHKALYSDVEMFSIESSNQLKNLTTEILFTKIKMTKRNYRNSSMSWPFLNRKKKLLLQNSSVTIK